MLALAVRPPLVVTLRLELMRRLSLAPQSDQTVAPAAVVAVNVRLSGPSKVREATGPRPPAKKISAESVDLAPAGSLKTPLYCTPTIATAIPAGWLTGIVSPQALRSNLRSPPAETRYCVNRMLRLPSAVILAVAEPAGQPGPPSPISPTLAEAAEAGAPRVSTRAIAVTSRPVAMKKVLPLEADMGVSTNLYMRARD